MMLLGLVSYNHCPDVMGLDLNTRGVELLIHPGEEREFPVVRQRLVLG